MKWIAYNIGDPQDNNCIKDRKDSTNRMQNKMNLSIFYAEVQPIFGFRAKVTYYRR